MRVYRVLWGFVGFIGFSRLYRVYRVCYGLQVSWMSKVYWVYRFVVFIGLIKMKLLGSMDLQGLGAFGA